LYTALNLLARLVTLQAGREQVVVVGFSVADMRLYREQYRLLVKHLGGGGPADAAGVFQASVLGDFALAVGRAVRKQLANARGKAGHELGIAFLFSLGRAFPLSSPGIGVGQAFALGALEGGRFDQQTLPLVAPASSASFEHGRRLRLRQRALHLELSLIAATQRLASDRRVAHSRRPGRGRNDARCLVRAAFASS